MRWGPLIAALSAQAGLWLWNLDLLPVWGDEQFTLDVIRLPWGAIPGVLARDIHPPLYYAAAKVWVGLFGGAVEPVAALRAFSVVCALVATVVIDRCWLAERGARVRLWFLALWTLSPCLLLYVRMGRSYALQMLLAAVALTLAARWRRTAARRDVAGFALAAAALLYVHYLPGLAVLGAVLALQWRRWRQAAAVAGGVAALYLPWAGVLWTSALKAAANQPYQLTAGAWTEHLLRIGYAAFSFGVGEALDGVTLAAAAILIPAAIWLAVRGVGTDERRFFWRAAGLALALGYVGAAQWVAFVFVPGRLLFGLPWVLLAVAAGAARTKPGPWIVGALLAASLWAHALYRQGDRLLSKGYLVPYGEIARMIEAGPGKPLIIADAVNGDPKPLFAELEGAAALAVRGPASIAEAERRLERRQRVVWVVRSARDVSGLFADLEDHLDDAWTLESTAELVPYSPLERRLLAVATGEPAPSHHVVVQRWRPHGE